MAAHRIGNPGKDLLTFIEVQRGDYFGEDDIIRLEDDYVRSAPGGKGGKGPG
jgi:mannose-6-phosphate isomerase